MLVLLDIGSTLLEGPPHGPGSRLAKSFGLPRDDYGKVSDLLFEAAYSGPDELAERIADTFSLPLATVAPEVRTIWKAQIDEAYPLPGAQRALDMIHDAGHTIAFVSNIWQPFLEAFCRHFPQAYAAYRGFYSFKIGISKPNPAMYQMVLDELGADVDNTIMIGDTYANDIFPALGLGMRAIWVLHRPEKERNDIVAVMNGEKPRPGLCLKDIAQLTAGHLR